MSLFNSCKIITKRGNEIDVNVANSVNIQRRPEFRDEILKRDFHRFNDPETLESFLLDTEFLYTDFTRNTVIKVKPRQQTHLWLQASAELENDLKKIPETLFSPGVRLIRVVFGLEELREKLVAQDAQIDDRLVELFKILLISEHPILLTQPNLHIHLEQATEENLEFIASYNDEGEKMTLKFPRSKIDSLLNKKNQERLEEWIDNIHRISNLFKLQADYWNNNFRRWSPESWAIQTLEKLAKDIEQNQDIDLNSDEFNRMLKYIPRGSSLPSYAKKHLKIIFDYAKAQNQGNIQDKFLEIRFNINLEDDWYKNNEPDDIDTLWKLLEELPPSNVEGNPKLIAIFLSQKKDGGFFQPGKGAFIGEKKLEVRENFEDIVRHEVGHAVYYQYQSLIEPWLKQRFGWQEFGTDKDEFETWVKLMGGWGNLQELERQAIYDYLKIAIGPGEMWECEKNIKDIPFNYPELLNTFGPLLAFQKTGAYWYENNQEWYCYNDKAFFLNFYYQTFTVVNKETLTLINEMPSLTHYGAMSPPEFFAELYALYYDPDDPKRKHIPSDVMEWLAENIG